MSETFAAVLVYYLIAYFIGAVSMLIVVRLAERAEIRRIKRQAWAACGQNEAIICINATIIEDNAGQISWIDNDTDIMHL